MLKRHPAISGVLAGSASVAEVKDNQTMLQQAIAPAFWDALRTAGLLSSSVP